MSFLVVRATHDTAALGPDILRTIRELDPTMPLPVVRPLGDETLALAMASRTLRLQLVAAFAALALVVSIVGLASALARSVTAAAARARDPARARRNARRRRRPHRQPRRAAHRPRAGDRRGRAAIAAGRALSTLLFGVSVYDPLTYAAVIANVLVVGLAAVLRSGAQSGGRGLSHCAAEGPIAQ